jgi:hypothetical protein
VCGDIYVCSGPPENVRIEEWVTIVRMWGYVAGVPKGGCQAADPQIFGFSNEYLLSGCEVM